MSVATLVFTLLIMITVFNCYNAEAGFAPDGYETTNANNWPSSERVANSDVVTQVRKPINKETISCQEDPKVCLDNNLKYCCCSQKFGGCACTNNDYNGGSGNTATVCKTA